MITKSFIHYSNKVFNESFIGLEGTVAVCERVNDKILDYIFINSNPDSIIYLGYGFGMGSSYYSLSDQDYNKVDLYSHSGYVENNYSYQKIIFDQINQSVVVRLIHELYPDLNSSIFVSLSDSAWEDRDGRITSNTINNSKILPFIIYDVNSYTGSYIAHRNDSLFITSGNSDEDSLVGVNFSTSQSWTFQFNNEIPSAFLGLSFNDSSNVDQLLLKLHETDDEILIDTLWSGNYMNFSLDPFSPNRIFLSTLDTILISQNFGDSFSEFITTEHEITGLYKKPESDLLYVLTRKELLEVNTESKETTSLKRLSPLNRPQPIYPTPTALHQNYPNPFNPTTTISYQLNETSLVQLEVFDTTGREVAVLVNGERKSAGSYQATFDAGNLASGVYFYRLETAGQVMTKKMLLLK